MNWKDKKGKIWDARDMKSNHIENTIGMLKRSIKDGKSNLSTFDRVTVKKYIKQFERILYDRWNGRCRDCQGEPLREIICPCEIRGYDWDNLG